MLQKQYKKLQKFISAGTYDADIAKYIPGMLYLVYHGMMGDIDKKEQPGHISYKENLQKT